MAGNNKQSEFTQEFLSAADKAGHTKALADAVGMPDDTDRDYIRKLIIRYEKKHPGVIQHIIEQAREDSRATAKFGVIDTHSQRRYLFELPEELGQQIEKYIPTIFREKKHFHWFVKSFPELLIPEKY